jgi:hypothetical protein
MFSMDDEARVRAMLVALGPGGTRELAERALGWADAHSDAGRGFDWLGGLAEVAALLDRSRPAVSNWMGETSKIVTPPPLRRLMATPVWDLRQWREWGRANPGLVGPGFDPFAED